LKLKLGLPLGNYGGKYLKKLDYKKPRRNFGSDIPPDKLQFYIPDKKTARACFRNNVDPRSKFLPPPIEGIKAHVGAGQNIREGYDNIDAYPNIHRADYVQTTVDKFARAETLDTLYKPDSLAEIRLHHVFEHISILDLDRTLRTWNKLLKMGGTVFLEVPDFDACVRRILALEDDARTEIFYRHIFGSQFTAGEYHRNGLTPRRLVRLLEQYGFEVTLAYTQWTFRSPNPLHMNYPYNEPLPDLTVAAKKVREPSDRAADNWTHEAYRDRYPNPDLSDVSPPGSTHPDEVAGYRHRREAAARAWLRQSISQIPKDAKITAVCAVNGAVDEIPTEVDWHVVKPDEAGDAIGSVLAAPDLGNSDAIFLVGVLEYVVDPMGALRSAVGALGPNGRLFVVPALSGFTEGQSVPLLAGMSIQWIERAFGSVGLRVDEVTGLGGPLQDLLDYIAEISDKLDTAGHRSHPLATFLRQGRHYPIANWLAHGGQFLGVKPNENVFCVVGRKVLASGGGRH